MEGLRTQIRQTQRFINENPSTIVFSRNERTPDGAGGFIDSDGPEPLDPQVVRVVQQRRAVEVERRNSSGEMVNPTITLVCMPDLNVMRGDTFKWQDLPAEVVWITDLGYVKHAEVAI